MAGISCNDPYILQDPEPAARIVIILFFLRHGYGDIRGLERSLPCSFQWSALQHTTVQKGSARAFSMLQPLDLHFGIDKFFGRGDSFMEFHGVSDFQSPKNAVYQGMGSHKLSNCFQSAQATRGLQNLKMLLAPSPR